MSAIVHVSWGPASLYIWNIQFVNWKHILYTVTEITPEWGSQVECHNDRATRLIYLMGSDIALHPSSYNRQSAFKKVKIDIPWKISTYHNTVSTVFSVSTISVEANQKFVT